MNCPFLKYWYLKCVTCLGNHFLGFVFPFSCWLLWLPVWKNYVHEGVPGEVQEAVELPSGRGPQTEGRAASTIVSITHHWSWYSMFLSTNHPLTVFLLFSAVPKVLSQRWVTQTPHHLTLCSSLQKPLARKATIQSHPCKWVDQMTSEHQVSCRWSQWRHDARTNAF